MKGIRRALGVAPTEKKGIRRALGVTPTEKKGITTGDVKAAVAASLPAWPATATGS